MYEMTDMLDWRIAMTNTIDRGNNYRGGPILNFDCFGDLLISTAGGC